MMTSTRPRTAAATEARKVQALTRKIQAAAALLRLHGLLPVDHNCTSTCPTPCPLDDDDPRGWEG